jgi:hypothetical protein
VRIEATPSDILVGRKNRQVHLDIVIFKNLGGKQHTEVTHASEAPVAGSQLTKTGPRAATRDQETGFSRNDDAV